MTLKCDSERRTSRRLHEQVFLTKSTNDLSMTQSAKEYRELQLRIATLKEDKQALEDEIDEFRKYSELLNAKFNLLLQEKSEVHEKNEEMSNMHCALLEKLEELNVRNSCEYIVYCSLNFLITLFFI